MTMQNEEQDVDQELAQAEGMPAQPSPETPAPEQTQEAPVAQPGTLNVEGREVTPEELARMYSGLHSDYTRQTQARASAEGVLQEYGLMDGPAPGPAPNYGGYENPPAEAQARATSAGTPSGNPMEAGPQESYEGQEPNEQARLDAMEANLELTNFRLDNPTMHPQEIRQFGNFREALENQSGTPCTLDWAQAVWLREAARRHVQRSTVEQQRQSAQQQQQQASQGAAAVLPGAGQPPPASEERPKTWEDAKASILGAAQAEMDGIAEQE